MNLKATIIAISSLFVCTTLWAGEFASQTIRLAHTAAVSHAHHEAAQLFAKNVADRTNGKVKVEVWKLFKNPCYQAGWNKNVPFSFS